MQFTGPQGLEQHQDRERARRAVRFLWARHEHRTRRLVTRAPELAPAPKRVPPRTEADRQLAAETAATVRELRELQLDLFGDDLELTRRYESGSRSSAVQEAAWGLLVGYWPSQRRWLRSKREPPTKQSALVSRRSAELHRPTWQHEGSREFWHRLEPGLPVLVRSPARNGYCFAVAGIMSVCRNNRVPSQQFCQMTAHLEELRDSPAYRQYRQQTQQVAALVTVEKPAAKARFRRIAGSIEGVPRKLAELPSGISLEPGRLEVRFELEEDLWDLLDQLADIAAQDEHAFRQRAEPASPARRKPA